MKLDDLRAQIDDIDTQILQLLAKRMEIVEKVGSLKRSEGVKGVFIRPKREDDMMKRILAEGAGKFPPKALFSIWRAIISASLQVENPFRVFTTKEAGKEVFEYFGAFTEYVIVENEEEVFVKMTNKDVGVLSGNYHQDKIPKHLTIFVRNDIFQAVAQISD